MEIIYNKIFLEHRTEGLPENKKRLEAFGKVKESKIESGEKFLGLVHSKGYIEFVKKNTSRGNNKFLDDETFISGKTYEAACLAAGATIAASQKNGFALVRPPGHHAAPSKGRGFCIFNNIAIASKKMAKERKKVAIFDFDGHYGDGTSEIFYSSDQVLYISFHQIPAYPATGNIEQIGKGRGRGFNVCVPLVPGTGDDMFIESFKIAVSIAKQFNPDIVGVSAGFDGHWSDPLLQLKLSSNSYYQAGKMLKSFKKVFAALEGGYNLKYLPKCAYSFISGINGKKIFFEEKFTFSKGQTKTKQIRKLQKLERVLSKYWKIS